MRAGVVLLLVAVALVAGAAIGGAFDPFGGADEAAEQASPAAPLTDLGAEPDASATENSKNEEKTNGAKGKREENGQKSRRAKEQVKTQPRKLRTVRGAGRANGSAWMAGTFQRPRLYVRYICPRKPDGCTVGLGKTRKRIDKPVADIAGNTGTIVEKPVNSRAMLVHQWVLVSRHSVKRFRTRERIIMRTRAPRLMDDLTRELRRPPEG
jgi:hypothetical protein